MMIISNDLKDIDREVFCVFQPIKLNRCVTISIDKVVEVKAKAKAKLRLVAVFGLIPPPPSHHHSPPTTTLTQPSC